MKRMIIAALFATVAAAMASCSSSSPASSARGTATPSPVVTFPNPRTVSFVATPMGPHDLSSSQALAVAMRANDELKLPAGTVAIHGAFSDLSHDRTPVWGFHFHECEVPHADIKTINPLCTRWVFLQSRDGSFVEATFSS